VLLVLAGVILGALGAYWIPHKDHNAEIASELGTRAKSGPWGELYTVPFSITAPDELLPVRALESAGTHWVFKNCTPSKVSQLLESADLPEDQRTRLLSPPVAQINGNDLELTPTPEMVVDLPDKARQVIYRELAQFPENRSAFTFLHKDSLGDRFDGSGLSRDSLALFHKLCCEHGEYLVLGGLPALLSKLPDYEEKLRLLKALTRQKTMFVRLRVTPESDPKALAAYWGKGRWAPNIRTFLEAIDHVPNGTFTSLIALLPPMPSSVLYFYPVAESSRTGTAAAVVHDCHWTSLNFFRDPSDTIAVDSATFMHELATDHFAISGDPSYGDIVILAKPDGGIVHSAIYIADDIVFTKNGATTIYPWMFSTVPDLLKQYSFLAPEGQQLKLVYYRNAGM
jgi:hypothetical protein